MSTATFMSAGRTETGPVRAKNEDAILVRDDLGLWVVADGVGGHTAGGYASDLLVRRLDAIRGNGNVVDLAEKLEQELRLLNQHLRELAQVQHADLIATTVVVLLYGRAFTLCGWAGDSRAYCFENQHLRQITKDHVEGDSDATLIPGAQVAPAPGSAALTRAVGAEEHFKLDWVVAPSRPGTQFLLCSDGINKELSDAELEGFFAAERAPRTIVDQMFDLALRRRSRDNASAIVVRLGDEGKR